MFVIFSIYARNTFPIEYKYMILSFSNIGGIYTFQCDITENIPKSQIKLNRQKYTYIYQNHVPNMVQRTRDYTSSQ